MQRPFSIRKECRPRQARPKQEFRSDRRRLCMKFIHIADVHLGAQPDAGPAYTEKRPEELWAAFEHVVGVCRTERTDLLLIAGDLFHRQPLLRELKEVNYLFSTLSHTQVVLIAGNHDYIKKDSYYRTFRWCENVHTLFGKGLECVEFDELQTAVYGLSYHSREIREPLYNAAAPEGRQKYEILLAHGGDDRHIPIDWENLERAGFSYVALGHIHKPRSVRGDRMVYAGALEPIDCNDAGSHGYVGGEITEKGIRTRRVSCASREYINLEIQVDEDDTSGSVKERIRDHIREYGEENIYKITLKGGRSSEIFFHTERMKDWGNVLEIVDETHPAYDFDRMLRENEGNLIGAYIAGFAGCTRDSEEYQALCEGVEALLENRGRV